MEKKKMTKAELMEALGSLTEHKQFQDFPKELRDRIDYTVKGYAKNAKAVTIGTLQTLLSDVRTAWEALKAAKPAAPIVEASPKSKLSSKRKTNAPKAPAKKPKVEAAPEEKTTARFFPDTLEVADVGTLTKVEEGFFKDFDALREFLNGDEAEKLHIATHWTKRDIKEFAYGHYFNVPAPKEFPQDLDIMTPIAVCDRVDTLWLMSIYTEAVTHFLSADLEPVEDTDQKTGKKFMVKVSAGLEFELYMLNE